MNEVSIEHLRSSLSVSTDGRLFWVTPKQRRKMAQEAGSKHSMGYRQICISGKRLLSHRVVWAITYGLWPVNDIDHINGDRSDNRIENLREATRSENMMNRSLSSNKSGVRGVFWDKRARKWKVNVGVGRVQKFIGRFDDLEFAELVASEARRKYHKEFARDL